MTERLVLFDIDETMISLDGAGRRAIGRALQEKFGIEPGKITLRMSGKTDPQILSEILKAASLEEKDYRPKFAETFDLYLGLLQEEVARTTQYIVYPGVIELLETLSDNASAFLGLLTGNIEPGARIKLNRFDLNKYFPMGAYGSDSANRMDLPRIATDRARRHYGIDFAPSQVVVIGDSIYDVMCAKGYGARSIAVNTGVTPRRDLEEHEPDFLFDNLADTQALVSAIFT
jgi:phosphoglycolate phosphatase-like HAD superfamily hydrolase